MFNRYFLNSNAATRINPHICGHRHCPPGWTIDRAFLDRFLLHYVVKGTGTFIKNGKRYSIHPGDLFICRPGESAVYIASDTDPWYYIWVGMDCSPEFHPLLQSEVVSIPAATRLFSQMVDPRCANREWVVCGGLYQLFALLSAEHATGSLKDPINQAVELIETNYSRSLQVTELADQLGLSRSYFCRSFKRQTGQSPQDFIITHRMEKAAQLLAESNLSQKEIARQVGYPDVYAFSRMFKRRFGVAPGQYKRTSQRIQAVKEE